MADNIIQLSDATFDEEVGAAGVPILVDFWAEWCGPCRAVAPVLAEIATEKAGKLLIGKVNTDENPDLSRRFEIMSIPTMMLFVDGVPKKRIVGAKGKNGLLADLAEFV